MKKYRIKTRNWKSKKLGYALLTVTPYYWDEPDRDIKCYTETKSALRAWCLWAYWMILRPLTGGWTYIIRPGRELTSGTYRAIY
uniref:Uncharacterized protein n=1 Tax=viral metagenome TaxID=1070528 RepID=A0A6M3LUB3_9ZZZZ